MAGNGTASHYPCGMANPRHTIHVGMAVLGIIAGVVLSIATGGDAFALSLAMGATSGIGYWVGAISHRKHG